MYNPQSKIVYLQGVLQYEDVERLEAFFQGKVDRCKKHIEQARLDWEKVRQKGYGQEVWMRTMKRRRGFVATEGKRMNGVKQQIPAVLTECAASLIGAPQSYGKMVEFSKLGAIEAYDSLVKTYGRPTRSIGPVPYNENSQHGDDLLHALCHWETERSQFEEELREWHKYLDYRQKNDPGGKTMDQLKGRQSVEATSPDFKAYQQINVDNAKRWVEFWEQQADYWQDEENRFKLQGLPEAAHACRFDVEDAQSYIQEAQEWVRPAELRLRWAEEQLAALLAESTVSAAPTSTHLKNQAKQLERVSRSCQSRLDKKKRTPADSALGPRHASRVSKAKEGKAPCCRPQSIILTNHNEDRRRGSHFQRSSPSPVNTTRRRSSRLSSGPSVTPVKHVGVITPPPSPPYTKLRSSERLSKLRESTNVPASRAGMNLRRVSLQHRRPSDPNGRLARNKSAPSSAKPR
ncbi:MAG: hypothetical protein Q9166_007682 [cf. Caloplaca sp. 2 TL-2023]